MKIDRQTALHNKMFESAMKGKVSNQRFLYQEFRRKNDELELFVGRWTRLISKWVLHNPKYKDKGYKFPPEVRLELDQLYGILNHYFPGQFMRIPDASDFDND